jgi:hypothetical protein
MAVLTLCKPLANVCGRRCAMFGNKDTDMTYNIKFIKEASFLHAIVTGINSKENVINYMNEIKIKCKSLNIDSVLIEENLEGPRLETLDVFQIAE